MYRSLLVATSGKASVFLNWGFLCMTGMPYICGESPCGT
nr:MAG TPA: hypothetical protein [Bacteriophage sp.]